MKRCTSLVLIAGSMVLIAGCDRKAEGQVAAIIDGEEITLQEVNTELQDANVPANADKTAARQMALQRIVQRRLLAQTAKDEGIDKSSEYLVRKRALDDALLLQLMVKKIGATIKIPGPSDIQAFVGNRPSMFADRSLLSIDRLQFSPGNNGAILKELEAARSMEQIAAALSASKIPFQRSPAEVDTARISAPAAKQLLALPAGEPFILNEGAVVTAGVITGKRAVPLVGEQASPVAVTALRNEQLDKAIQQRLAAAKSKAKIEYQSGFAPPKVDAAGAPAGGKR